MKIFTSLAFSTFAFFSIYCQTLDWAKSIGSTSFDQGLAIVTDASGNVYTTGRFQGTIDFDPGMNVENLTAFGLDDIFVQKMDATGNFVWAKSIGGASEDFGQAIALDPNGNVYVTGIFQYTVDFDPGVGTANLTSSGSTDVFVLKLDGSGNYIWAKTFGGVSSDHGIAICVDQSSNVFTTGQFQQTVDFDPGVGISSLSSAGDMDIFVQKLDGAGNFLWAKSMGGTSLDRGLSICVDVSGNVYTTGHYSGTADFDPGTGAMSFISEGLNDIFVQKMNPSGSFQWAVTMGGPGDDVAYSIAVDFDGNLVLAGSYEATADLEPGVGTLEFTSLGYADVFVENIDAGGNLIWVKSFGGTMNDFARSITADNQGYIYTTGHFGGTMDADPSASNNNLISNGHFDCFIQKMDAMGNFEWASSHGGTTEDFSLSISVDAAGNVYTTGKFTGTADLNPGTGTLNYVSSGADDIFIQKLNQCASTTSSISPTECGTYQAPDGANYNQSGNYIAIIPNVSGCDSIIQINLTIIPIQQVTVLATSGTINITSGTSANYGYQWVDCDNGNASINGATNDSYTPLITGTYAVQILFPDGCTSQSNCENVIVQTSSIDEVSSSFILLYPNPVSTILTVELDQISTIQIMDITGNQVINVDGSSIYTLDVSNLTPGIYFVRTNEGSTLRFIKE